MRIAFRVDGGIASFPGLRQPVTFECDRLPSARSARLKTLVEGAKFFTVAPVPPQAGGADRRTYTLEIDDGGKCRTLTLAEPIADAGLRALIDEIRDCVRTLRA